VREHRGSAYETVKRRTGDWAIAAAGAALTLDGPSIASAGIALSAVNPTEVRSGRAEEALAGRPPSDEAFEAAATLAAEDCAPVSDLRGPADYKRHLARELTQRALRRAAERALAS
jgi:carbon-monoxide dehydrogenase medium subunit